MIKKKRLFFDIETSPNIGFFWSAGYKLDVPYNNIIKERSIICICYKWEGEKKVHSLTWDKNQDDKEMLTKFVKIANEADELIGHNSDKFDLPWIRTRCLYHRIPILPKYTTLDTLKKARSTFRFNSNKLDYIAKYLGVGEKIGTSFDLWRDIVLNNSKKALGEMVEYCKGDVTILEEVFHEINNYLTANVHYGVLNGLPKYSCPNCGSEDQKLAKIRASAAGTLKYQMQCKSCNKYNTISATDYKKLVENED